MPDIYGKYSLTEIARELDATPAFINRIQRETGIGGKLGTKGRMSSFDSCFLTVFRRIKVFRAIGFSFREIKEIWTIEGKMIDILGKAEELGIEVRTPQAGFGRVPFLLHPDASETWDFSNAGNREVAKKFLDEWNPLLDNLETIAKEVQRRGEKFIKEVDEIKTILNELNPESKRIA